MKYFITQSKRLFVSAFQILSLSYLIVVLFGWLYSDSLIFFPQKGGYAWADDLIKIQTIDADDSGKSHQIVARYLINPDARYTLLYSHGNATDLSQLLQLQQRFYNQGYSIIIYDYSGYGLSEGSPSEQQVYNDVQAVYQHLLDNYSLISADIIAYGHSLGAAIATELAFKKPVAALVVESPFVTAFRVRTVVAIVPFDKFASIDKIGSINAPLLLMHSRDDPVIPFWHGELLFEKAALPKQNVWFDNAGHSGITHDTLLWPEFNSFVTALDNGSLISRQR